MEGRARNPVRTASVVPPWAFSVAISCGRTVRRGGVSSHIRRCRYLQFALWGFVGDWASVAALEAIKLGRPYSLHIDSVNHVISRRSAIGQGTARRIKAELEAPMMKRLHAYLAGRSALGLWHGNDTYQVYSRWCANSHNIHDIHTRPEDCIAPAECEAKAREAERAPALRVCYAGRALAIKGPLDWVRAVAYARELGAEVEGVWIGDGPMLDEARGLAKKFGLAEHLSMPGFVSDRARVLERPARSYAVRASTPESPRCLLESLLSGTPIIGYDGAFARLDRRRGRIAGADRRLAKARRGCAVMTDRGALAKRFARRVRMARGLTTMPYRRAS